MRLQIIIGYPDHKPASDPFPVYVGRDGAAAERAMAESSAARFEVFRNPVPIRKNNPHAARNAAARLAEAPAVEDKPAAATPSMPAGRDNKPAAQPGRAPA